MMFTLLLWVPAVLAADWSVVSEVKFTAPVATAASACVPVAYPERTTCRYAGDASTVVVAPIAGRFELGRGWDAAKNKPYFFAYIVDCGGSLKASLGPFAPEVAAGTVVDAGQRLGVFRLDHLELSVQYRRLDGGVEDPVSRWTKWPSTLPVAISPGESCLGTP